MILLTSGSGTVVQITPDDYFYNVNYESGQKSSGRTYVVAKGRTLLDPSDTDYLDETGTYLSAATAADASDFYTAMFKLLAACDSSKVATLSSNGEVVLSDFLGIYTAESMRHDFVNLAVGTNAYEVDIGEVTLTAAYSTASGQVMQDGKLVSGPLTTYSRQGHSIGVYEADYRKLAKLITSYENAKKHHPDMIKAITKLTPITSTSIASAVKGDVFRRVLVYLNRTEFESKVNSHADKLTTAMVQLLAQIRADQADITTYVLAKQ